MIANIHLKYGIIYKKIVTRRGRVMMNEELIMNGQN